VFDPKPLVVVSRLPDPLSIQPAFANALALAVCEPTIRLTLQEAEFGSDWLHELEPAEADTEARELADAGKLAAATRRTQESKDFVTVTFYSSILKC